MTTGIDGPQIILSRRDNGGIHANRRLFEWFTAFSMLGIAFRIWIYPTGLESGALHYILLIAEPRALSIILLIGSLVRIAGLWLNGLLISPLSNYLRTVGALVGGAVWAMIGASLTNWNSPLDAFYWCAAAAEAYSCFRAARDVVN